MAAHPASAPTSSKDRVQFFVHDSGRGIEAERLPTIFGRFTGDPASDGTGLGLALVRRLVEVSGGQVAVESRLGAGTTFSFTVPMPSPSPLVTPWRSDDARASLPASPEPPRTSSDHAH